ncbi:hypothetical protein KAR91_14865 [Candidatus Pacearchaeota archaeon]|nr:hypothetical protein [Candidatus Pacearchaeota archaeon]
MIDLVDRRDYWEHLNGETLSLVQLESGSFDVDKHNKHKVKKKDLTALAEVDVVAFIEERDARVNLINRYKDWSPELAFQLARLVLGETVEDLRLENGGRPSNLELWVDEVKARG